MFPCQLVVIILSSRDLSDSQCIVADLPSFPHFHAATRCSMPTPSSKAAKRLRWKDKAVTPGPAAVITAVAAAVTSTAAASPR